MGMETTTIAKKYVVAQETTPSSAFTGMLWFVPSSQVLWEYDGSTWVQINVATDLTHIEHQQLVQNIDILTALSHTSTAPSDYDTIYADIYNDSTGYSNTIDTGNTDATFDTDNYKAIQTTAVGYPTGATSFYSFDEASGNALDVINSHTGTQTGTCTRNTGKMTGNCFTTTSSSNYFTIANHTDNVFGTGDFTICFWFNNTGNGGRHILCKGTDYNSANGWSVTMDGGGSEGMVAYNENGGTPAFHSSAIDDGNWHHIAITRSGTDLKMYVDNGSPLTATSSQNLSDTSSLYVGINGGLNYSLNGSMDSLILIKGTAWSSTDVATDYNAGAGTYYIGSHSASTKYVQTTTLTMDDNLTAYQVYCKDALNGTGALLQYAISFDNGSTWSAYKDLDTKYSNTTSGTSIKLKFKLFAPDSTGSYSKQYNYALMVWY